MAWRGHGSFRFSLDRVLGHPIWGPFFPRQDARSDFDTAGTNIHYTPLPASSTMYID
jgi:hypothetical protein